MEYEESLKASTVVGQATDSIQGQVDDLLSDGVVSSGVVISSILLSRDELLRVEERAVGSSADLVCKMYINT